MTFQTTHHDQLVSLFNRWSGFIGSLSYSAKTSEVVEGKYVFKVTRENMESFYGIRDQLWVFTNDLREEIGSNQLNMNREQYEIIYLFSTGH